MDLLCGLVKLVFGFIEILCEDGGGVGIKDVGDGVFKVLLGELAVCRFFNKGK